MSNRLIDMSFKEPVNHLSHFKSIDYDRLSTSWRLGNDDDSAGKLLHLQHVLRCCKFLYDSRQFMTLVARGKM